jgi:signal transduction histidine kinase/DNA-binding response OmpR family regulator
MIARAERADAEVSFSRVRPGEGKDIALLDACFPIKFRKYEAGLVVITADFVKLARALTRSPRHLVFLAGSERRLLMYPHTAQSAGHVLTRAEADREDRREFTETWLTNQDDLVPSSFKPTLPVLYRYSPGRDGFGDDKWLAPPDLQFLLLRYRVRPGIGDAKREELTATLRELREKYPSLVVDTEINLANQEVLIRGWKEDEATLREVRATLKERFGSGLELLGSLPFLNAKPLLCTRFIRNLYKFSLEPDETLPEQCLYVGMASPIEVIDAKIDDNLADILGVALACVLGAVALAVIGSHFLTRPLKAITAATQHLAAGGNDVPLPVEDTSEIGALARSFARMAEQIRQRQREIADRNEHLEDRVRERTRELEEANVELAHARDKAENVAVAKDYFLATVSHELRTPLNHVIGFIQLLEMTALDEDQLRDVDKIHHAADNLLSLVNDLLDYQKIVQGALSLEPTPFDLAPWLEELAGAMRPAIAAKGNELAVQCPAEVGTLYADEKRVRQAVTNLLSNAAKFTRAGRVTLSARRERDRAGDWIVLDVSDTGRGMTPQQQTKLFQPFTKLLSRSDNPEGTGLGLALSQKLCRLMGGDVVLSRSEPDAGSTFTIRLPAPPIDGPVSPSRPLVLVAPALSRKVTSVLVIDDDPDVRELMRRHLEGQGFVVHLVASGAEGLELVKKIRPDAITLDVLMPGIDGWGTLAALQADAETCHIPVIMITMLDDRTRGFALGAWEFLPKPISWSRLIDLLNHVEPHTGPVLLVDDDPAMRELASRTLSQHGWDVFSVENGKAALEAAARRKPVMVLLDLLMPVMDGFEFLEAFRKEPAWREVPVVVLTAKHLTDDDYRRLDGSVQKILSKGMSNLVELLREVEWLLHNHMKTATPAQDAVGESVGSTASV